MKKVILSLALLSAGVVSAQIFTPNGTVAGTTTNSSTGNVGIGTDNPQAKLHILKHDNDNYNTIIENGGGNGKGLLVRAGSSGTSQLNAALEVTSWDQTIPKFWVGNNGNVGIGTTNPQSKFHVGDNSGAGVVLDNRVTSLSSKIPAQIFWAESGSNTLAGDLGIAPRTDINASVLFYTNNGSNIAERMRVAGNGNVGIGTIAPSEKLEIYDSPTSPAVLSLRSSRNDFANVEVGRISGKQNETEVAKIGLLRGGGTYTGFLTFHTKPDNNAPLVESMRIAADGNVGIGTTNPQAKLDVNGTVHLAGLPTATTNTTYLTMDANGNVQAQTGALSGGNNVWYKSGTTIPATANTDNVYVMGKVGIGTQGNTTAYSNDPSKLIVKGYIHAEEVRVDLQVPADYVFQKYYTGKSSLKADYTMPTLAEVEKYTKEHNHLPNIPSAQEIKEKGLQIGEMSNLLLQKIEELTLYSIEQQKRIEALEKKLSEKK